MHIDAEDPLKYVTARLKRSLKDRAEAVAEVHRWSLSRLVAVAVEEFLERHPTAVAAPPSGTVKR